MRLLGVQLDIVWEDRAANHGRVAALLESAAPERGALVVLPEMFATGFSMDVAAIAESADGPTHRFLAELARRWQVYVLGGVATPGGEGRGRNECVACSPEGAELARYAKLHPFGLGGERERYEAGEGLARFAWGGFQVAPFICYDLRFPEVFRAAARRGATLFAVIANWPVAREEHWVSLLRARAIENQAYVVGVNRCGTDPRLTYPGRSLLVGPDGEVRADAGRGEGILRADLDPAEVVRYRAELPFLPDMREDFVR